MLRHYELQIDHQSADIRRAAHNLLEPTAELLYKYELPTDLTLACIARETGQRNGLRHPKGVGAPEFTAIQSAEDEYSISASLPLPSRSAGVGINVVQYCITLPPKNSFGGFIDINGPVRRSIGLTPMDPRSEAQPKVSASDVISGLAFSLKELQASKGIDGFRSSFEANLLHRDLKMVPGPRPHSDR